MSWRERRDGRRTAQVAAVSRQRERERFANDPHAASEELELLRLYSIDRDLAELVALARAPLPSSAKGGLHTFATAAEQSPEVPPHMQSCVMCSHPSAFHANDDATGANSGACGTAGCFCSRYVSPDGSVINWSDEAAEEAGLPSGLWPSPLPEPGPAPDSALPLSKHETPRQRDARIAKARGHSGLVASARRAMRRVKRARRAVTAACDCLPVGMTAPDEVGPGWDAYRHLRSLGKSPLALMASGGPPVAPPKLGPLAPAPSRHSGVSVELVPGRTAVVRNGRTGDRLVGAVVEPLTGRPMTAAALIASAQPSRIAPTLEASTEDNSPMGRASLIATMFHSAVDGVASVFKSSDEALTASAAVDALRYLANKQAEPPVVHVTIPDITVPAPVVHLHVPEQPAPVIHVAAPDPSPPPPPRRVRVEYAADGSKSYVTE